MTNQCLVTKDKNVRCCLGGVGGLVKRRGGEGRGVRCNRRVSVGRGENLDPFCRRFVFMKNYRAELKTPVSE